MDNIRHNICVFCGSSPGRDPAFARAARETGQRIAEQGWSLVFGGGALGLMGEVARAARDHGANVTGILPDFLRHLEPPLTQGETVQIVPDLYRRKQQMIDSASGFIVLPGGLGTLDEFFEVVTSAQLAVHTKPVVLLNTNGYYRPLIALTEHIVREGFAKPDAAELYRVAETPKDAIAILTQALAH
jgi:uncharacterized protein (TIGR00730 family)